MPDQVGLVAATRSGRVMCKVRLGFARPGGKKAMLDGVGPRP